jgi:hypothetical protein
MIGLLREAVERARSYSPAFPIDWANQLGLVGVVYRQPIAVYYVEADLIAIIGLITLETAIEKR